jgi:putative membrane protein
MVETVPRSPPVETAALRDRLAVERTVLASERTLLAFARTALTLFVAGVSFLQFFPASALRIVGWLFVPAGVVVMVVGLFVYRRTWRLTREARRSST